MAVRKFFINIFLLVTFALFIVSGCTTMVVTGDMSPEELYKNAQENLRKQRFEEAKYNFKQLYKNYPDSELADNALFRLGYIACAQGEFYSAEDYFSTLLEDYPRSEWAFDSEVWNSLLSSWKDCRGQIDRLNRQLKVERNRESGDESGSEAIDEIESLQQEIEDLKEENKKLRELIESMQ